MTGECILSSDDVFVEFKMEGCDTGRGLAIQKMSRLIIQTGLRVGYVESGGMGYLLWNEVDHPCAG